MRPLYIIASSSEAIHLKSRFFVVYNSCNNILDAIIIRHPPFVIFRLDRKIHLLDYPVKPDNDRIKEHDFDNGGTDSNKLLIAYPQVKTPLLGAEGDF